MKKALMWTGAGVGAAIGAYYAIRGVRRARSSMKQGLGRAEQVADNARSVLDTTQKAIHDTRQAM
jgi:hypothetical protein